MPNTVAITLGGKDRALKFDFNAIADLAIGLPGVFDWYLAGHRSDFGALRALLWAGLRHEEPALTPVETGNLIEAEILADPNRTWEALSGISAKIDEALISSGMFQRKAADKVNGKDEAPPFFQPMASGNGSTS